MILCHGAADVGAGDWWDVVGSAHGWLGEVPACGVQLEQEVDAHPEDCPGGDQA